MKLAQSVCVASHRGMPPPLPHLQQTTVRVLCPLQVDFVAVDSVAALLPRAELEGVIADQQVMMDRHITMKVLSIRVGVRVVFDTKILPRFVVYFSLPS